MLSDAKSKTFCLQVTSSLLNIFLELSNLIEGRGYISDFSTCLYVALEMSDLNSKVKIYFHSQNTSLYADFCS